MGLATTTTVRTIDLARDQLVIMDAPWGRIEVAHGCLWLTVEGEAHDTFLAAGDSRRVSGKPVVLGAAAAARVRLVGGVGAEATARVRGWRRLWRATRRQVQRLQFGPAEGQTWT